MADKKYMIKGSTLEGLADSVRAINNSEDKMTVAAMKEELDKVPAMLETSGEKHSITLYPEGNGLYEYVTEEPSYDSDVYRRVNKVDFTDREMRLFTSYPNENGEDVDFNQINEIYVVSEEIGFMCDMYESGLNEIRNNPTDKDHPIGVNPSVVHITKNSPTSLYLGIGCIADSGLYIVDKSIFPLEVKNTEDWNNAVQQIAENTHTSLTVALDTQELIAQLESIGYTVTKN